MSTALAALSLAIFSAAGADIIFGIFAVIWINVIWIATSRLNDVFTIENQWTNAR